MSRGSLGVRELNVQLQNALNPAWAEKPFVEKFGWQALQRVQERGRVVKHHRWRSNGVTRRQRVFGWRAGIYFPAREVILEGKLIVRPATMNTPSPGDESSAAVSVLGQSTP
jgi:hypothetical protein